MLEFCGMLRLFNSSGILALWNNIIYVAGPIRKKERKKETLQCDEHSFTSSNILQVVLHNHDVYCEL